MKRISIVVLCLLLALCLAACHKPLGNTPYTSADPSDPPIITDDDVAESDDQSHTEEMGDDNSTNAVPEDDGANNQDNSLLPDDNSGEDSLDFDENSENEGITDGSDADSQEGSTTSTADKVTTTQKNVATNGDSVSNTTTQKTTATPTHSGKKTSSVANDQSHATTKGTTAVPNGATTKATSRGQNSVTTKTNGAVATASTTKNTTRRTGTGTTAPQGGDNTVDLNWGETTAQKPVVTTTKASVAIQPGTTTQKPVVTTVNATMVTTTTAQPTTTTTVAAGIKVYPKVGDQPHKYLELTEVDISGNSGTMVIRNTTAGWESEQSSYLVYACYDKNGKSIGDVQINIGRIHAGEKSDVLEFTLPDGTYSMVFKESKVEFWTDGWH